MVYLNILYIASCVFCQKNAVRLVINTVPSVCNMGFPQYFSNLDLFFFLIVNKVHCWGDCRSCFVFKCGENWILSKALLVDQAFIIQAFETESCLSQNSSCGIVDKVSVSSCIVCFWKVAVWHNNEVIRTTLPNIHKTVH